MTILLFAVIFALSGLKTGENDEPMRKTFLGVLIEPGRALSEVIRRPFTVTTVYVLFIAFLYIVFIGYLYGRQVYGSIPSYFGGGQPSSVMIAFSATGTSEHFGLSPGQSGQSEVICLIATSEDGIVVYDPTSRHVAFLTTGVVSGVVDNKQPVDCSAPP